MLALGVIVATVSSGTYYWLSTSSINSVLKHKLFLFSVSYFLGKHCLPVDKPAL